MYSSSCEIESNMCKYCNGCIDRSGYCTLIGESGYNPEELGEDTDFCIEINS
jgi:hypothetical protein